MPKKPPNWLAGAPAKLTELLTFSTELVLLVETAPLNEVESWPEEIVTVSPGETVIGPLMVEPLPPPCTSKVLPSASTMLPEPRFAPEESDTLPSRIFTVPERLLVVPMERVPVPDLIKDPEPLHEPLPVMV